MNNMIFIWAVLIVVFFIAEIGTAGALVSIWFCLGAAVALLLAWLDFSILIQATGFVVVSVLLLVLTKPFIKKHMHIKEVKTNADRLIGTNGVVYEKINNLEGVGAVKIDGQIWSARAESKDGIIEKETVVVVEKIEGVRLIVKEK